LSSEPVTKSPTYKSSPFASCPKDFGSEAVSSEELSVSFESSSSSILFLNSINSSTVPNEISSPSSVFKLIAILFLLQNYYKLTIPHVLLTVKNYILSSVHFLLAVSQSFDPYSV